MSHNHHAHYASQPNSFEEPWEGQLDVVGDRFELLSAYLDGEVSAKQRQQVQQWLDTDPEIQALHQQLLYLRQTVQALPIPEPDYSVEDLVDGVFAAESQRQQHRWLVWGSGAVAAVAVGALSLFTGSNRLTPRLAEQTEPEREKLMIAVSQPVVDIPAIAEPLNNANLLIPLDRPVVDIPQVTP